MFPREGKDFLPLLWRETREKNKFRHSGELVRLVVFACERGSKSLERNFSSSQNSPNLLV